MELTKEEQLKQLNQYAKPYADVMCKTCYGRGHIGYNITKKKYELCFCVERNLIKAIKESEIKEETVN